MVLGDTKEVTTHRLRTTVLDKIQHKEGSEESTPNKKVMVSCWVPPKLLPWTVEELPAMHVRLTGHQEALLQQRFHLIPKLETLSHSLFASRT